MMGYECLWSIPVFLCLLIVQLHSSSVCVLDTLTVDGLGHIYLNLWQYVAVVVSLKLSASIVG
jgi:hypothetical protein